MVKWNALFGANRGDTSAYDNAPETSDPSWINPVTMQDVSQRVQDIMNSGQAGALNCALDHALGGTCHDPAQTYVTLPSCQNVSVSTCTTRIRDAGVTGDLDVQELDPGYADLEIDPGKVTDLYPPEGESIETQSQVTIQVNPTDPDPLSAVEQDVADALQDSPDNDDSVKSKAKTLARECVRNVTRAGSGRTAADCTTRPIFFTGDDAREVADHDLQVLASRPDLVMLNKRSGGIRNAQCDPQAQRRPSDSCDEYPFLSTMQGEGGVFQTAPISYQWVDGRQNGLQGRALGVFYNIVPRFGFPAGCAIVPDDPQDWFLAIPLPKGIAQKTTWACNRPIPMP